MRARKIWWRPAGLAKKGSGIDKRGEIVGTSKRGQAAPADAATHARLEAEAQAREVGRPVQQ